MNLFETHADKETLNTIKNSINYLFFSLRVSRLFYLNQESLTLAGFQY